MKKWLVEQLFTWGWAVLVIVMVLTVLWYIGALTSSSSPSNLGDGVLLPGSDYCGQTCEAERLCAQDCLDLNRSYYKFKTEAFSQDECWCRVGNETSRAW